MSGAAKSVLQRLKLFSSSSGTQAAVYEPCFQHGQSLQRCVRAVHPNDFDYGLCSVCRTIEFASIFPKNGWAIDVGVDVFVLPPIAQWQKDTCPLCAHFLERVQAKTSKVFNVATEASNNIECEKLSRALTEDRLRLQISDGLMMPELVLPGVLYVQLDLEWKPMKDLGSSSEWPHPSSMMANRIDFTWLAREVRQCDIGKPRSLSNAAIPGLKLIDCDTNEVIEIMDRPEHLAPKEDYLALSYVWGHDDNVTLYQPYDFPPDGEHGVAQVIIDALQITRAMGFRFLWVDRYCIDQSSDASMSGQLQLLGEIFATAFATIVSLGPDDNACIPGLRPRDSPVNHIQTASGRLHPRSSKPSLDGFRASSWMSRAWTLQEACLSKRLIVFEDDAVSPITNDYSVSDAFYPDDWMFTVIVDEYQQHLFHSNFNPSSWGFEQLITDFSKRSMTFERDAMDAFRGCLKLAQITTYWAVPCWDRNYSRQRSDRELAFLAGLWWEVVEQAASTSLPARVLPYGDLPSWSWICGRRDVIWTDSLRYDKSNPPALVRLLKTCDYECTELSISTFERIKLSSVSIEQSDGSTKDIWRLLGAHSVVVPERTRFLYINALQVDLSFDHERGRVMLACADEHPEIPRGFKLHSDYDYRPNDATESHLASCELEHRAILLFMAARNEIIILRWLTLCLTGNHALRIGVATYYLLYKSTVVQAKSWRPKNSKRRFGDSKFDTLSCVEKWIKFSSEHREPLRIG